MNTIEKTRIAVNTDNSTIEAPHLGVTLRTLFGAAVAAWPGAPGQTRPFTVQYKGKDIATLNVHHHN